MPPSISSHSALFLPPPCTRPFCSHHLAVSLTISILFPAPVPFISFLQSVASRHCRWSLTRSSPFGSTRPTSPWKSPPSLTSTRGSRSGRGHGGGWSRRSERSPSFSLRFRSVTIEGDCARLQNAEFGGLRRETKQVKTVIWRTVPTMCTWTRSHAPLRPPRAVITKRLTHIAA